MVRQALQRRELVADLLSGRDDVLVISGLGSPTYDVHAAGDRKRNFYLWGAMGSAALMGLGLALARPDQKVLVITGDGEQLMGTGGLATIAVQRPTNLTVLVLDNGHFGETGMQKSHTSQGVDLVGIAQSCGFARCLRISASSELAAFKDEMFVTEGPSFVSIAVEARNLDRSLPTLDGVFLKNRLRNAIRDD